MSVASNTPRFNVVCKDCKEPHLVRLKDKDIVKRCKPCSRIHEGKKAAVKQSIVFFKKAKLKFGARFDYSLTVYTSAKNKLTISCNKCSTKLSVFPANHLNAVGTGCKVCAQAQRAAEKVTVASEEFVAKAIRIHGDLYDYTDTIYSGSRKQLSIFCNSCGTDFTQIAGNHLQGSGCSCQTQYGFDMTKPAVVYYFKIKNVYKIGITNGTIEKRYNVEDRNNMSELTAKYFETGAAAYEYEQSMLKLFNEYAYRGPTPFTNGTKSTECFTVDIYKI